MRIFQGRTVALAVALALLISIGGLAGALPASAAGPINQFNYPMVPGVQGSSMSVHDMNLSVAQRFQVVQARVPWLTSSSDSLSTALLRYDSSRRLYAGISGQYCKNKTGGDVFVATGVPAAADLTC